MASWPVTLPDEWLQAGFAETAPDNVIASDMDVGPPKTRRRSSAAVRKISGNVLMTTAQVAIHDTFFSTTLYDGAQPFDWTNPRTDAAVSFLYQPGSPPVYTKSGPGHWIVALNILEMP